MLPREHCPLPSSPENWNEINKRDERLAYRAARKRAPNPGRNSRPRKDGHGKMEKADARRPGASKTEN